MSSDSSDLKDQDSSVDLFDEALVRDLQHQMSPIAVTEEVGYECKSSAVTQNSSEKVDTNNRKSCFHFYVGNLTWWTTDVDIANLVVTLGVNDLLEIRIFDKRTNGQSKGFSQISVGSERSFRTCMESLSGKMLNGTPLIAAPYTKNWLAHFEAQAQALSNSSACQYKNQKIEAMPPSQPMLKQPDADSENRGIRPILPLQKLGFSQNNSNPPHCQQLPPRMPIWPAVNRPGPLCDPSVVPPRRPPIPLQNVNSGTFPTGSSLGPGGPNQWRMPPKMGPMQQQQPPQPLGNWPRAPSPHHGVYHQPGRNMNRFSLPVPYHSMPFFYPQGQSQGPPMFHPQPYMVPPNHVQNPMYGRQPSFNRAMPSASQPQVNQTLPPIKAVDELEDETIVRNRAVSSKALSKAVSDVGNGSYSAAIETLTTAIDIIEQSKLSQDERSRLMISTLKDMLEVVIKTMKQSDPRKRLNEGHYLSPSSHSGISRSYRARSRNRSRSLSRSRSRSRSRERAYHRGRSHRGKDESCEYSTRERERRDRVSTSSRRRSERSSSRSRYESSRDRERDRESRRSYECDPSMSARSKNSSPPLTPERVRDWERRRRDS